MADIIVDTNKLEQYASRISNVNSRIARLDRRMDALYRKVNIADLYKLIKADTMTSYSLKLKKCGNYLRNTAEDFEAVEKKLQKQDPLDFKEHAAAQIEYWTPEQIERQRKLRMMHTIGMIGFGMAECVILPLLMDSRKEYNSERSLWSKYSKEGNDYIKVLYAKESASIEPKYGEYADEKALGELFKINKKQQEVKDFGKKIGSEKEWYEDSKKATILEEKFERKLEGGVLEGSLEGENDWGKGSIEGDILPDQYTQRQPAGFMHIKRMKTEQ